MVTSTGELVGNAIMALHHPTKHRLKVPLQYDSLVIGPCLALPQVQRPVGRVVGQVGV